MPTTLQEFAASHRKTETDVRPGDTVRVTQRIKEGEKSRTQAFEGLVIATKHGRGVSATFTVRKVADGYGVERVFPLHSPMIETIRVLKRADVRRSKLYFIRVKAKRETRKKMKRLRDVAAAPSPNQEL
jgi:large subunit ribosomal protein L19